MLSRREFIGSVVAGGVASAWSAGAERPNLRVGLVSDVHVTHVSNAQWL